MNKIVNKFSLTGDKFMPELRQQLWSIWANVNEELAQELQKPVIKNLEREKVYARFKDNIWAADLAAMELLSSKNLGVEYLLCVIDVFTKYVLIKPLKNKTSKTVNYGFNEIVIESKCQPYIIMGWSRKRIS